MFKYNEIKEILVNEICSLPPHTRIMSRNALCRKYQVTRTTVDRTIKELLKEGYLYAKVGSGTYVQDRLLYKDTISSWGVIFPNIAKEVYPDILSGIEAFASGHNRNVIICSSDNDAEKEYDNIVRLLKSDVKGFIIIPYISDHIDYRTYHLLKAQQVPYVFCNRQVGGIQTPFVGNNGFYGGFLATKRLIATGAKRIAYISEQRYAPSIERYSGYCAGLETSGIALDERLVRLSFEDMREVEEIIAAERPEAIFAFNDTIASKVFTALLKQKLAVGKEVSLIGYDNSSLCNLMSVKLTSVSYRSHDIGFHAAGTLYQMQMEQRYPPVDVKLFQPEIIERESCLPILD